MRPKVTDAKEGVRKEGNEEGASHSQDTVTISRTEYERLLELVGKTYNAVKNGGEETYSDLILKIVDISNECRDGREIDVAATCGVVNSLMEKYFHECFHDFLMPSQSLPTMFDLLELNGIVLDIFLLCLVYNRKWSRLCGNITLQQRNSYFYFRIGDRDFAISPYFMYEGTLKPEYKIYFPHFDWQ